MKTTLPINSFLREYLSKRVFFLSRKDTSGSNSGMNKFEMRQVAVFDDHESQVWRVSWNVTGTVLASSGDDGCVRLWKGEKFQYIFPRIFVVPAQDKFRVCKFNI